MVIPNVYRSCQKFHQLSEDRNVVYYLSIGGHSTHGSSCVENVCGIGIHLNQHWKYGAGKCIHFDQNVVNVCVIFFLTLKSNSTLDKLPEFPITNPATNIVVVQVVKAPWL